MTVLCSCRPLFALAAVLAVGCKSLPKPGRPKEVAPPIAFTAANRPVFATAYYPYGPCMRRHLAAPIPNYTNWTPGRMAKDVRRMQDAGFSEALVCLDTDMANDAFPVSRALRFVSQSGNIGGPRVAFLIGPGKTPLRRDVFAKRLVAARAHTSEQMLREGGRVVVYLRDGVDMMGESHPAILFRKATKDDWFWADSGTLSDRTLTREDGLILQHSIWQAYRVKARRILIAWNDFETGNFVEPNSHDSVANLGTLTVRTEVRRVEDTVRAAAAVPALAE
jgi:hypothetical protein